MINIRDSGFYDPLRDARTAAWLERAYVVESQLDGKRASRPVGRPTGASKGGTASLKRAILAYGDARQNHGSGEAVKRALAACMQLLDQK